MNCVICRNGNTKPGYVSVTLEKEGSTIIFREVPADVCENCGEYYLSEEITGLLLERANKAVNNGALIEIQKFAA